MRVQFFWGQENGFVRGEKRTSREVHRLERLEFSAMRLEQKMMVAVLERANHEAREAVLERGAEISAPRDGLHGVHAAAG